MCISSARYEISHSSVWVTRRSSSHCNATFTLHTSCTSANAASVCETLWTETLGLMVLMVNSLSESVSAETKRLNFGLSPELRSTNHCSAHHCSVHNVVTDVIADISVFLCLFTNKWKSEVIFVHQNLISNRLTYLVHAKSTGELISFGFNDRSVRNLVSAKCSVNRWVQTKNDFTFWMMFGLSPNLGLGERMIHNVKWSSVSCTSKLIWHHLTNSWSFIISKDLT